MYGALVHITLMEMMYDMTQCVWLSYNRRPDRIPVDRKYRVQMAGPVVVTCRRYRHASLCEARSERVCVCVCSAVHVNCAPRRRFVAAATHIRNIICTKVLVVGWMDGCVYFVACDTQESRAYYPEWAHSECAWFFFCAFLYCICAQ